MADIVYTPKYFTLPELCITSSPFPNIPSFEVVKNLKLLCYFVLDPLRDHLGCPLLINSAFRTKSVNAYVGGVPTSNHLLGLAADVRIADSSSNFLLSVIQKSPIYYRLDEVIKYQSFVHISLKKSYL